MVSGVEEARRAVREQIGHGPDLIKVYADWEHPTLTVDEIRVVVEEAHKQKRKGRSPRDQPRGNPQRSYGRRRFCRAWAPCGP